MGEIRQEFQINRCFKLWSILCNNIRPILLHLRVLVLYSLFWSKDILHKFLGFFVLGVCINLLLWVDRLLKFTQLPIIGFTFHFRGSYYILQVVECLHSGHGLFLLLQRTVLGILFVPFRYAFSLVFQKSSFHFDMVKSASYSNRNQIAYFKVTAIHTAEMSHFSPFHELILHLLHCYVWCIVVILSYYLTFLEYFTQNGACLYNFHMRAAYSNILTLVSLMP